MLCTKFRKNVSAYLIYELHDASFRISAIVRPNDTIQWEPDEAIVVCCNTHSTIMICYCLVLFLL